MGSPRTALRLASIALVLFQICLLSAEPHPSHARLPSLPQSIGPSPAHILFLIKRGEIERAVHQYHLHQEERGSHDFTLLRQMAKAILAPSQAAESPESLFLALYGVRLAADIELLPVVRTALFAPNPALQMAAIDLLGAFEHDTADDLLIRAMSSPFLGPRLEAGARLAEKRHPQATSLNEAFMAKVAPELYPLFPELYALASDKKGDAQLRRLLAASHSPTRRAALLAIAHLERDDFLPDVRRLSRHLDPLQQEVCAYALGALQDTDSTPRLEQLTQSGEDSVRLAALLALYQLGHTETKAEIEALALTGMLPAIAALKTIPDTGNTLAQLTDHGDISVRVNTSLALLTQKDRRCLPGLQEILIRDGHDWAFQPAPSAGGALRAFKATPSLQQHLKKEPLLGEMTVAFREAVLIDAAGLEEDDFLRLTDTLFAAEQNDLIPITVQLLENLRTEGAMQRLRKGQHQALAPLARAYCHLALYRMEEEEEAHQFLLDWLADHRDRELIQLRPVLSRKQRKELKQTHELTPKETSRILIDALQVIAQKQNLQGVDTILDTMAYGAPGNRFVLAGLLLNTLE